MSSTNLCSQIDYFPKRVSVVLDAIVPVVNHGLEAKLSERVTERGFAFEMFVEIPRDTTAVVPAIDLIAASCI